MQDSTIHKTQANTENEMTIRVPFGCRLSSQPGELFCLNTALSIFVSLSQISFAFHHTNVSVQNEVKSVGIWNSNMIFLLMMDLLTACGGSFAHNTKATIEQCWIFGRKVYRKQYDRYTWIFVDRVCLYAFVEWHKQTQSHKNPSFFLRFNSQFPPHLEDLSHCAVCVYCGLGGISSALARVWCNWKREWKNDPSEAPLYRVYFGMWWNPEEFLVCSLCARCILNVNVNWYKQKCTHGVMCLLGKYNVKTKSIIELQKLQQQQQQQR